MLAMNVKTEPAFARRLRLSTASIVAAIILTCAALLAVAVAVRPASDPSSAVPLVGPVSSVSALPVIGVYAV